MAKNPEQTVFKLPDSGVRFYWWLGLAWVFCLASWGFFAWADWQANGYASMSKIVYGIWLAVFVALLVHCIVKIRCYRWNQITVFAQGISQVRNGSQNIFIGWKEIARISPNSFLSRILVVDDSGKKKIVINYKYENIEDLLNEVFRKYIDEFKIPEMPVRYGVPRIPYEMLAAFVLTTLIFALGWFFAAQIILHVRFGFLFFFLPIFGFVGPLFGTREVILSQNGITLFGFTGEKMISWNELESFGWEMQTAPYSASKKFVVSLRTEKNECFSLAGWAGHQVAIFLAVKKIWNGR